MDRQDAIEEGYKNLATAIVAEAIMDIADPKPKGHYIQQRDIDNADNFIKSNWCYSLCGIDYEVLKHIAEEKRKELRTNGRNKNTKSKSND